jgi:meso-butanediol dehydrogenase / (S,S)-butanediol dehydrogenase / diacetyl reductase
MRTAGGGAIVVTASCAGLRGDPYTWAYNASKAAAINLVRSTALDYAYQGIRINAIAPGFTLTPRTAAVRSDSRLAASLTRRIPMQRWADPREQAEVIWFLGSPASSYVTGAVISSDGGLSASNGLLLPPTYDGEPMG